MNRASEAFEQHKQRGRDRGAAFLEDPIAQKTDWHSMPGSIGSESPSPSACAYALYVVRDDGERRQVVEGGDQEDIRNETRRLAEFLDAPVWNAT